MMLKRKAKQNLTITNGQTGDEIHVTVANVGGRLDNLWAYLSIKAPAHYRILRDEAKNTSGGN